MHDSIKAALDKLRGERFEERQKSIVERVWGAPAEHNRATRRRAGLLSRIWRWEPKALGYEPQAPRQVRRWRDRSLEAHAALNAPGWGRGRIARRITKADTRMRRELRKMGVR